jgi:hypothetical protein
MVSKEKSPWAYPFALKQNGIKQLYVPSLGAGEC